MPECIEPEIHHKLIYFLGFKLHKKSLLDKRADITSLSIVAQIILVNYTIRYTVILEFAYTEGLLIVIKFSFLKAFP